jgi:two-component system cell cycle response regulator
MASELLAADPGTTFEGSRSARGRGEGKGLEATPHGYAATAVRGDGPDNEGAARHSAGRDVLPVSTLAPASPILAPASPTWPDVPTPAPSAPSPGSPSIPERRLRCDTPLSTVLPAAPHRDRATLTFLNGVEAGSVLGLEASETVLGRAAGATLSIDEPTISRHHARVIRTEDGRHVLEDLGSKNGTFVNGHTVTRVPLRAGDRVQLGPALLFLFSVVDEREETLQRRLYESSTRDALTGLTNRRSLLERLELAIARGEAEETDVGVLMIDVDHFKRINDTFGHAAGDNVLRALAMSAAKALRAGDLFARYGGEEFVAVICGATKDDLVALAERVRLSFATTRVEIGSGLVEATVSVGVALWSECRSRNYLDLVAVADERMYLAKLGGRNGVCATETGSGVRPTQGRPDKGSRGSSSGGA